jgi:hypothetical protein
MEQPLQVTGEPGPGDVAAVMACLSDYYDGYFESDPVRMRRCLHPELVKRSVGSGVLRTMSADDMVEVAAEGEAGTIPASDRRWSTESVDVRGNITAAVVVSVPFVDYVHLGRLDGAWRIVNVLWSPR